MNFSWGIMMILKESSWFLIYDDGYSRWYREQIADFKRCSLPRRWSAGCGEARPLELHLHLHRVPQLLQPCREVLLVIMLSFLSSSFHLFYHVVLSFIIFSSLWLTMCRILLQSCGEVGWKMLFLVAVDIRSLDQLAFFRLMYPTLLNLSNWCGEGARVSNCTLACPPYNHIVLLVLSMFILSFSD